MTAARPSLVFATDIHLLLGFGLHTQKIADTFSDEVTLYFHGSAGRSLRVQRPGERDECYRSK